jgi:hypothetical protein
MKSVAEPFASVSPQQIVSPALAWNLPGSSGLLAEMIEHSLQQWDSIPRRFTCFSILSNASGIPPQFREEICTQNGQRSVPANDQWMLQVLSDLFCTNVRDSIIGRGGDFGHRVRV